MQNDQYHTALSSRQQALEQSETTDSLTGMLRYIRMQSVFYTRSELSAPWGIEMPAMPHTLMFHYLVSGQTHIQVGEHSMTLKPGEFVLIPQGQGHVIRHRAGARAEPLFDLALQAITEHYDVLGIGGGGENSLLLCGAATFNDPFTQRLLQQMPALLFMDLAEADKTSTLVQTLQLLAQEAMPPNPVTGVVISRLADVLMIHSIGHWLQQQQSSSGWVAAWKDKNIGRAVRAIHQHPEADWTVTKLASQANMSRTRFADVFRAMTQVTPLHYLTEWRFSLAQDKLRHSQSSLLDIALSVGYQSEAAFSRAFKKWVGQTPMQYRKAKGSS